MKIFFKNWRIFILVALAALTFLALSFNRDYRINFGDDRIELGKLFGDGMFVVDVARNEVWSGGYNKYLGKMKNKHFFQCENTQSDAICFSRYFYYDVEKTCFLEVTVVPSLLEISTSFKHFDHPNAILETHSLEKCF